MTGEIPIGGTCDPHFAPVREAFIGNFRERGEPGGAVALMVDGRLVADLWGGWRDAARQTPWARETLVNFFSVGKAFTALVALRLVERWRLARLLRSRRPRRLRLCHQRHGPPLAKPAQQGADRGDL